MKTCRTSGILTRTLVPLLLLASLPAQSEPAPQTEAERQGWYLSTGGEYLVREQHAGNLHALLSTSRAGETVVYVYYFDNDCKTETTHMQPHDPVEINGTLVRMQQYCDGDRRYFLPATDAGRAFLVQAFRSSNRVEFVLMDQTHRFLFSAKDFIAMQRRLEESRRGL